MEYKIYLYILLSQLIICDLAKAKAIMGQTARAVNENEYSSVVCITRYNPELEWEDNILCTGTLLSNMFVLSAQHCLEDSEGEQFEISMGAHQVANGERYYPIWWITYDQWTVRMGRPPASRFNDVILIKIFGLPHRLAPAILANIPDPNLMHGLDAAIVGCGKINATQVPSVLHTATVRIITIEQCIETVSRLQGIDTVRLSGKYYCSIGVPIGFLEKGDSGGPLIYFGVVVGVNIATCPIMDGGIHDGQVNIHVNLYYYNNFLIELMQNDNIF